MQRIESPEGKGILGLAQVLITRLQGSDGQLVMNGHIHKKNSGAASLLTFRTPDAATDTEE